MLLKNILGRDNHARFHSILRKLILIQAPKLSQWTLKLQMFSMRKHVITAMHDHVFLFLFLLRKL